MRLTRTLAICSAIAIAIPLLCLSPGAAQSQPQPPPSNTDPDLLQRIQTLETKVAALENEVATLRQAIPQHNSSTPLLPPGAQAHQFNDITYYILPITSEMDTYKRLEKPPQ